MKGPKVFQTISENPYPNFNLKPKDLSDNLKGS